jgi:hypothetical protein
MGFVNNNVLKRNFFQVYKICSEHFIACQQQVKLSQFGLLRYRPRVGNVGVVPLLFSDLCAALSTTTVVVDDYVHKCPGFNNSFPVVNCGKWRDHQERAPYFVYFS